MGKIKKRKIIPYHSCTATYQLSNIFNELKKITSQNKEKVKMFGL